MRPDTGQKFNRWGEPSGPDVFERGDYVRCRPPLDHFLLPVTNPPTPDPPTTNPDLTHGWVIGVSLIPTKASLPSEAPRPPDLRVSLVYIVMERPAGFLEYFSPDSLEIVKKGVR